LRQPLRKLTVSLVTAGTAAGMTQDEVAASLPICSEFTGWNSALLYDQHWRSRH
jgi:hypothetical protein